MATTDTKPAGQDTTKPAADDKGTVLKPGAEGEQKPNAEGTKQEEKPKVDDSKEGEGKKEEQTLPEKKAPAKYELKRPEDDLFTDADLTRIENTARAMDLTQEQAQALIDGEMEQLDTLRTSFLTDLKADKDIGGAQFEASVALANEGVKAFLKESPKEEREAVINLLEKSGYGNHKALVRAFARLGKLMREDSPDSGGKGGAKEQKTDAQAFYGAD